MKDTPKTADMTRPQNFKPYISRKDPPTNTYIDQTQFLLSSM